jgi:hypothetical protein
MALENFLDSNRRTEPSGATFRSPVAGSQNQTLATIGIKENQMARELTVGDTVYTPCTCFESGETWLEEKKVKEIDVGFIVLTHVATLRNREGELERQEVVQTEQRYDQKVRDYYSQPFVEIMSKYREQNAWFVEKILSEAEK